MVRMTCFWGKAPLDQLQEGTDGGRRVINFRVKAQACTGAWKQIFVRIQQDLTRANLVPAHVLLARGGLVQLLPGMEYKQFIVKAFEHEPGKWRASVERANGKPLLASRRMASFTEFVTAMDTTTPEAAMQMALAAIDSGAFSRTHS